MNRTLSMPAKLKDFCNACSQGLAQRSEPEACIGFVAGLLPELVTNRLLFLEILEGITRGDAYLDLRYATMFDSEVILYRDPARFFSIRMFLWEPGEYDPVHDHNSWGVVSSAHGNLEVVHYMRRDDASNPDHADLVQTGRHILRPGETTFVCGPDSIHKTGNPTQHVNIQISIYGRSQTNRDYINGFDEATGRIYRIYAPKVRKLLLARQALAEIG